MLGAIIDAAFEFEVETNAASNGLCAVEALDDFIKEAQDARTCPRLTKPVSQAAGRTLPPAAMSLLFWLDQVRSQDSHTAKGQKTLVRKLRESRKSKYERGDHEQSRQVSERYQGATVRRSGVRRKSGRASRDAGWKMGNASRRWQLTIFSTGPVAIAVAAILISITIAAPGSTTFTRSGTSATDVNSRGFVLR